MLAEPLKGTGSALLWETYLEDSRECQRAIENAESCLQGLDSTQRREEDEMRRRQQEIARLKAAIRELEQKERSRQASKSSEIKLRRAQQTELADLDAKYRREIASRRCVIDELQKAGERAGRSTDAIQQRRIEREEVLRGLKKKMRALDEATFMILEAEKQLSG
ncbi:hypothetical protein J8273_3468 [Carpediemonas membranifera]|uniref:Uncharacterized protein n=1 Tax=Carpediemonas membranifera TaxID=201153 RepID=A0A8J6B380_9EUKA|nr:hypothetical protein J8273_3463 [Carpediemonas membranifera]KAG9393334.1 hypothetical protein J8273_3468 [Carpediemonas membranifera]|eukprot:KAG9393329.1 hypothetical protein J8273_3463 [Carpediemonas membranifera]